MLRFIYKICLRLVIAFVALSVTWVLLYKWVPVKWTPLMLKRSVQNSKVENYRNVRTWVEIEDVAPVMVRAILASEDGRFMEHGGFDLQELRKMKREHKTKGKKIRGCSTVSQQVAKNCFTFCGRSWWRKGFETYYTFLIELLWSKKRIMEVYLNIAEMGPGVFGVEAASRKYFNRSAAKLTTHQAVSMACVLPNPLRRNPKTVSQTNKTKYNTTYKRTQQTAYPFK
ncbi:MAG: monofunctional biosynthetic peptidoglycan transglycosylase [Bacteroidales bacterium]|nr:monofunctional biosynthetic peptidoglycan transglycosylase [Bacteroidales bacterium]